MPRERLVKVALPVPVRRSFTYEAPDSVGKVLPGSRVLVPFGPKRMIGYALEESGTRVDNVRRIEKLFDEEPLFPAELFGFIRKLADYYLAPLGLVIKNAYPSSLDPRKKNDGFETARRRVGGDRVAVIAEWEDIERRSAALGLSARHLKTLEIIKEMTAGSFPAVREVSNAAKVPHLVVQELEELGFLELFDMLPMRLRKKAPGLVLNGEQQRVFEDIAANTAERAHKTFLVHGVTGSGKTEIYLRLLDKVMSEGGRGIYLVPEISLASYLSKRLLERFGSDVAILHSAMNDKERARQWLRMRKGGAKVVIGPRSALFSPLDDVRMIIVDEEHDSSYRQADHPFYNARDMAILRASLLKCPVVLGSATPSVESYYNATEGGKYGLGVLRERVSGASMPELVVVDMRKVYEETRERTAVSPELEKEIEATLSAGEQVVILRNRLGYSTFILCRECGKTVKCTSCDISLTYHKKRGLMKCHFCGKSSQVPAECPECRGANIQFLGEGTEKIEGILSRKFPEARIGRMDRDAVVTARDYEELWNAFESKKIDILVGTQMIAKGYHNPEVTLVGIISADFILGIPDFRSAERAYQLITQAAGRSGRGQVKGKVVVQSYFPGHYAVSAACLQDYEQFYRHEIAYRKALGYPPAMALGRIEVNHSKDSRALETASECAGFLRQRSEGFARVLGPNQAPLFKLEDRYRYQMIIKTRTRSRLHKLLGELIDSDLGREVGRTIFVDVDPASML